MKLLILMQNVKRASETKLTLGKNVNDSLSYLLLSECKIFSQNKVKTKLIANAPNNFYASIAPIRMLHLKSLGESVEDVWKPLWKLPYHEEERFKVARSDWDVIQLEVVEFLRSRCFLK